MISFLTFVMIMSTAVLIGSIIFLSFVFAPTVFQVLDTGAGAQLLRAVFPRYYRLCLICCASGSLAALALAVAELSVIFIGCALILLALTAITAYSISLVPRINAARDNGPQSHFESLHRRSVGLNAANLFLAVGAFSLIVLSMTKSL